MAPFSRSLSIWACVVLVFLSSACQIVGGGSGEGRNPAHRPTPEEVIGLGGQVYQGRLSMEGGDVPAALELVREGRRDVKGALQAASGLLADGTGRLDGSTLRIELTYGGECPGRMLLVGDWDRDEGTYEGTVQASDCTGRSEGVFRFSIGHPEG